MSLLNYFKFSDVDFSLMQDSDVDEMVALINPAFSYQEKVKGEPRTNPTHLRERAREVQFVVARKQDKIVGCVYIEPQDKKLHFGLLTVADNMRGTGLAPAMMQAIEDYANANSFTSLELHYMSLAPWLKVYYEKYGFKENDDLIKWGSIDLVGMTKQLSAEPRLGFRPLLREDFLLLQKWLEAPHVKRWWKESTELEEIEKKYGPRVDGKSLTKCFITLVDDKPVGMVQAYWVKDYQDYDDVVKLDDSVAIDWFIGEEGLTGKGLGPKIANAFVYDVVNKQYHGATSVVASPSIHNPQSIRALEKAGFEKRHVMNVPGEDDPEQLMVLSIGS